MRKITFKFIITLAILFSAIYQVQAEVTYCNDFGQNISDNTRGWAATTFTVFTTKTTIDVKVGGSALIADGELYNGVANTDNVIDVYQDNDATILLDKGSASFNWIHFTAYADWNADGIFDPVTEKLFFDSNNTNTNRTYTIKVPATATLGQTRIRIIMGWLVQDTDNTAANYYSPCMLVGSDADNKVPKNGRVFDFLLNVKDASESTLLALKAKILEAKAFTNIQYPIGAISGMYPQVEWDALQTAITNADEFINSGDTSNQINVEAQLATLKAAINDLNGSMVLPFKVSDDVTSIWYQVSDMRDTKSYWEIGTYTSADATVTLPVALLMSQTGDNTSDSQLFKFVKAPSPSKGYYIYSKLIENNPLSASIKSNFVQINADSVSTTWQFGKTVDLAHYTVFTEGDVSTQLNSKPQSSPAYIAFYYPGIGKNDVGNNWEFVELLAAGQTDFTALKTIVTKSITMMAVNYPVSHYSAEKWDAFVTARTTAIDLVAKDGTVPQVEQTTVDAMVNTLQTSIDELTASYIPFVASTDTESHYYFIKDKRSPASYMYIGTTVVTEGESIPNRLLYKKVVPTADSTAYMFKVVAVSGEVGVYNLYSKSNPEAPLSVSVEVENLIHVSPDGVVAGEDTKWTFGATPANDVEYRTITSQTSAQQINSFSGAATGFIGFWSPTADDAGNDWSFVSIPVVNAVKNVAVSDLGISVRGRRIVCADTSAKLNIYSILGQKINANAELGRGIYLVRVNGKSGTVKVLVK